MYVESNIIHFNLSYKQSFPSCPSTPALLCVPACVWSSVTLESQYDVLSACVSTCVFVRPLHFCRGRINNCVGQANHRSFLLTLILFLLTSLYGISLVLQSVCPKQFLLTALLYCPGVYDQYRY